MKRLILSLLLVLLLAGCGTTPVVEEPEFQPTSGVQMDISKLQKFEPVEEIYTRRYVEKTEDLIPGDYGMLRPFVGSRAAFDITIYGNSGIYNGNMGLVDETGEIVVDAVYTDVSLLTDWNNNGAPKFWKLSKEIWKDNEWGGYMEQIHGFCTLDGSVAEPCIYESISHQNGYLVAVENSAEGLFRIFDDEGNLLLNSADWAERSNIYMEMGYGTVEVSEHLLFIGVEVPFSEYGMERWLYDWDGNLITKDYDFVTITGEAPYPCGSWGGGDCGYLDEYGNLLTLGYESVSEYHNGQAIAKRNGQSQVIDTDGNVLWIPDVDYFYTCLSDTAVYYQLEVDEGMETISYRYYDSNFEQLYPEADHVSHMFDDWFLVWEDGVGRLDNGEKSAVLEGAVLEKVDYYYGNDIGADDLLLITTWVDSEQFWWLFDEDLNLLAKGVGEGNYAEILPNRLDGDSVAVTYERMSYPAKYTVLDYPGAPKLGNVNLIAAYGNWYMVEDAFSAGYMDKDGNWLFRISLMEDMTD